MHKCSWTSMRGLIASAQRFPRFLWHVRMPFVAMALPWCHTADMLTCKVVAVAIYTPATQSALSVYLTLLVFSFSLICFLSFNFYKLSSTSTNCFFLRPSPLFPAPTRVAYTSGWCLWTWQSLDAYSEGRGVGRPLSVAVYNSAGGFSEPQAPGLDLPKQGGNAAQIFTSGIHNSGTLACTVVLLFFSLRH